MCECALCLTGNVLESFQSIVGSNHFLYTVVITNSPFSMHILSFSMSACLSAVPWPRVASVECIGVWKREAGRRGGSP